MAEEFERAGRQGLSRRKMLAVSAAAGAAVWAAPHIETLGFAPAGALPCGPGSTITFTSDSQDDKNANSNANAYCDSNVAHTCCAKGSSGTQTFGNASGHFDTWTFTNPIANCGTVVVTMVPLDCSDQSSQPKSSNANYGQFAIIMTRHDNCNCEVAGGYFRNNGTIVPGTPFECTSGTNIGPGKNISQTQCNLPSSTRLAVQINCTTQTCA